jgi:hypothetical protein
MDDATWERRLVQAKAIEDRRRDRLKDAVLEALSVAFGR